MKKTIALVAMCATAFSPILSSAAYAEITGQPLPDAADAITLGSMQTACNLIATTNYMGPDRYTAVAVPSMDEPVIVSGPTERPGTRTNFTNTILVGVSFSNFSITGDPYRIGGSVNMFGDLTAGQKNWTNSSYDYEATADSKFAFAFDCDIYRAEYVPPVEKPGGFYTNPGQGDCNGIKPVNPHWGEDIGACKWNPFGPPIVVGVGGYEDPEFLVTVSGGTVEQSQDDLLAGHEDNGGPGFATGNFPQGQTVICISPSTTAKKGVPGAWVAKNYYNGGSFVGPAAGCNTPYFIVAPTNSGSTTSHGTYISVPDYAALTTP